MGKRGTIRRKCFHTGVVPQERDEAVLIAGVRAGGRRAGNAGERRDGPTRGTEDGNGIDATEIRADPLAARRRASGLAEGGAVVGSGSDAEAVQADFVATARGGSRLAATLTGFEDSVPADRCCRVCGA